MTVNKLQLPAKDNAVQLKINEIIDNLGGGGATDVQINGTSITSNNVANILTESAYSSSNKIATMSDLPSTSGFLENTATGTNSLTIGGTPTSVDAAINIGYNSSVALSAGGQATRGTAIGVGANVTGTDSIQLGMGTASSNSSLYAGFYIYGNYQLLDGTTGLIPDARISANIARTSQIPSTSGLANTSLSNLSSTGKKVIDGQWVAKETSLTTSTAVNTYTLDLVNYLPSGGGKYEVLVACNITSNNTSPSNTRLYSDIISISTNYLNQKTPNTSHSLQAGCLLILPVTRYLYFKIENHATASTTIIAEGYRRIGTNT